MTTISNNRRKRKISGKTAAFLIVITLLLCAALLWRDAAASFLWRIVSPILSTRDTAALAQAGFFAQFGNLTNLIEENARLRQELASTSALLLDRHFLYQENADLKQRLGRSAEGTVVLATVLLRPPAVPYGVLMIDVGKNAAVTEGMLVAAAGSAYIGRVTQVYDTTARITLFSAPGQTHEALLRGSIPLALEGEGSGSMRGELPVGIPVAVGDPVLLPGIMPTFLAVVTAVMHEEGQSFQSVYLTLPVNPLELRFVEVHSK